MQRLIGLLFENHAFIYLFTFCFWLGLCDLEIGPKDVQFSLVIKWYLNPFPIQYFNSHTTWFLNLPIMSQLPPISSKLSFPMCFTPFKHINPVFFHIPPVIYFVLFIYFIYTLPFTLRVQNSIDYIFNSRFILTIKIFEEGWTEQYSTINRYFARLVLFGRFCCQSIWLIGFIWFDLAFEQILHKEAIINHPSVYQLLFHFFTGILNSVNNCYWQA